ncbi:hypothetical protein AB0873_14975 [Micromonospora sp. NPDC047707]|uniref:DUF7302 family protein n=1 Tax=Micromonospora sp. NPDC047707 TaxID=3154498 RepID=UPI0034565BD5
MRITMKTLYASPERSIAAGATADVPDDEAQDLIDRGFAVPAGADEADGQAPRPGAARKSPPAPPDGDEVPDGSIAVVLAWVGEDRDRAAKALDVERATKGDRARVKLVEDLTKLLESEQPE